MNDIYYPIKYLHRAFNILESQGHIAFRNYVNRVEMPPEDIERVLNKSAYIHNPEFKAKIDKIITDIKNKGFKINLNLD